MPPDSFAHPDSGICEARTVGIISNGKEGTAHFFAHLERVLRGRFGVAGVVQRVKSNLSAPAERAIMDEAAGWDAAITGVGD